MSHNSLLLSLEIQSHHIKRKPYVIQMTSRFCYSYQRRPIEPLCCTLEQQPITFTTLSTMATLSTVVFNQQGATSQTLLQATTMNQQRAQQQQTIEQKVSTLLGTSDQVTDTLQRQLASEVETRYQPYRPIIPEFIPSSVMELEMRTRNVGVPVPTMTIANCKGVQFVTR
jgi:hypothetical protein